MLSNAYFLAKFRFDTAENEPAKNLQNFTNFPNLRPPPLGQLSSQEHGRRGRLPAPRAVQGLLLRRRGGRRRGGRDLRPVDRA